MAGKGVVDDPSLDSDDPLEIGGAAGEAAKSTSFEDLDRELAGADDAGGSEQAGEQKAGEFEIVFDDEAAGGVVVDTGDGIVADPGAGGAEDDFEKDPGFKDLTRNMQERLRRERSVKLRERGERERESAARVQAQIGEAAAKVALIDIAMENVSFKIAKATSDLRTAMEAGETDKVIEAQKELNTWQMREDELKRSKPQVEAQAKQLREGGADKGGAKNPLTEAWMGRNKWFGNDRFSVESRVAASIDQQMAAEGLDARDPKYFAEWDRRIREHLPTLTTKLRGAGGGPGAQRRAGPGTAQGGSARQPAAQLGGVSKGRVVITGADKTFMREIGLDPSNKAHLQQFAGERMKLNQGRQQ